MTEERKVLSSFDQLCYFLLFLSGVATGAITLDLVRGLNDPAYLNFGFAPSLGALAIIVTMAACQIIIGPSEVMTKISNKDKKTQDEGNNEKVEVSSP